MKTESPKRKDFSSKEDYDKAYDSYFKKRSAEMVSESRRKAAEEEIKHSKKPRKNKITTKKIESEIEKRNKERQKAHKHMKEHGG